MPDRPGKAPSRRAFIKAAGAGVAASGMASGFPAIVPASVFG
jgi:hypothetical protein